MYDLLSAILDTVRMRSIVWGRSELAAPWGIRFPASPQEMPQPPQADLPEFLRRRPPAPGGAFHVILRGHCVLQVAASKAPVAVESGDLIVLLGGPGHTLRDRVGSPTRPVWELHPFDQARQHKGMQITGTGPVTSLVHGVLFFENQHDNRLLTALPPILHLKGENGRSSPWLEDIVRLMNIETSQFEPGAQAVVNHLVQVLFIRAVRAFVGDLPSGSTNWLRAAFDDEIGPVLAHIHRDPAAHWTVRSLADAAGLSRSAFAGRFTARVGQPPLQYLTGCRMHKAAEWLSSTTQPVKQIARAVGYRSDIAFSKAFRRFMGSAPGAYRRKTARSDQLPPAR